MNELTTFVVRVTRDAEGLSGIVERVKTGEKARFRELEAIGSVIAVMLESRAKTEKAQPSTNTRREQT